MIDRLNKTLPSRFIFAVTIGGVMGLGILRGPGEIAQVVSNSSIYLILWLIGGIFVLLSLSITAELFGMTARSGGTYALVRRAYGGYSGFVIGWVDWLSFSADLALKAVVISEFMSIIFPEVENFSILISTAITTVFALIQLRGIVFAVAVQEFATAIIGLIIVSMTLALFFVDPLPEKASYPLTKNNGIKDWSLVIATIIFTYDGWLYGAYFGEEIKGHPGTAARACIKGMVVVIGLYMLLNFALLRSTNLSEIAGADLAIAKALELLNFPLAENIVVIAAILILLGHQNLEYMSGSRILYALARDGLASKKAKEIGASGNPTFSILATWSVTVVLIFVGGFEFLLLLSVFFYVPIYLALITGVIILRMREPNAHRPYEAWGHPYSTSLCLVGWIIITLFQGYAEKNTALYALGMAGMSWPVYQYLTRKK